MTRHFEIAIVGGGITGATLAAAMVAKGIVRAEQIVLIAERSPILADPQLDIDLRVYAINRASQRLLEGADIWMHLAPERVCAYERVCVWDSSADFKSGSLQFDCAEVGEPDLGHIVEGRAVHWQAFQAVRRSQTTVIEGSVNALVCGSSYAEISMEDGRRLKTGLVIAADGAGSALRANAGIGTSGHAYHQTALVMHVRTERPHAQTAWQRFLPTGPIAFLPLKDGRSSIVWSLQQAEAERVLSFSAADLAASVTTASGGVLGNCQLDSSVASFTLNLQIADRYVRERFVLIGDAAHSVHPLAGQGLNLGFGDCSNLMSLLSRTHREEWGELRALRQYERDRQSENLLLASAFDGLDRLFSNTSPLLAHLRTFGLSTVASLPPLKRFFSRRALGAG